MFEGVQDQFHQFLAAAAAASSTPQPPIIRAPNNSTPHHQQHHHHHLPLPPPLSFSLLHGCTSPPPSTSPNSNFPIFESYPPHPQHQIFQQQVHLQWPPPHSKQMGGGGVKQEGEGERTSSTNSGFLSTSLVLERERSMAPAADFIDSAWSHDEVLALLRIRSAAENWFPEFTWEHVSRKLSEMGFKRSPQKCKEKFEEESGSYFHPATTTTPTATANTVSVANDVTKNNYRLFSELEELYHHGHHPPSPPHHHHHHILQQPPQLIPEYQTDVILEEQNRQREEQEHEEREERQDKIGQERSLDENNVSEATHDDDDHRQITVDDNKIEHAEVHEEEEEENTRSESKKRRNRDHQVMNNNKKFDIFKSFCEEIVSKMMAQQEQLHNKILQDMIKRDEEKIAREEAWKKQEMERNTLEMEARAKDLALVGERQAKIIEFLKKLSSNNSNPIEDKEDGDNNNNVGGKTSSHPNPSSSATHSSPIQMTTSSNEESISNTNKTQPSFRKPRPSKRPRSDNCNNDIGKRWPREEVLALINIRCNVDLSTRTGPDECSQSRSNSNSSNKSSPLWERISQKMIEMGYNRSAKRCKEKWENINKYFRKTKDMNKNRSVDSRTCPYFHQLSHLYNQGRVSGGAGGGSASGNGCGGGGDDGAMNVGVIDQGEGVSGVQVAISTSDLEF